MALHETEVHHDTSAYPEPKQTRNDIDVYLRSLVEELLLLWGDEGVRIWDARGESSPIEVTISTLTENIFFTY